LVAHKLCLICKQRVIASWESACEDCWRAIVEHDLCPMCHGKQVISTTNQNGYFTYTSVCTRCNGTGWVGNWREYVIMLNHVRETLRECGVDLLELNEVIKW